MNNELQIKQNKQIEGAKELNNIFERVLPWALEVKNTEELIKKNSIQSKDEIERFLNSLYLFKVTEISISETLSEDTFAQIYKKHQALIIAAYKANLTINTVINGDGGGVVDIFISVGGKEHDKETFRRIASGIYPGKGIEFIDESHSKRVLVEKLKNKTHGGILTGIPTQKLDDEKQKIDLTTVIRSMYGQKFVFIVTSRPVNKKSAANQLMELMNLKDRCHSLAIRNLELNQSTSRSKNKAKSSQVSKTDNGGGSKNAAISQSLGINASMNLTGGVTFTGGIYLPVVAMMSYSGTIGGTLGGASVSGGTFGGSKSDSVANTNSIGTSESIGWSKSVGKSMSFEQQNSLAMELELIADKLIQRLRVGLNNGVWENFITYATTDQNLVDVLSGALSSELIKADPDAIPMRNFSSKLSEEFPLIIPKSDSASILTGNPLVSYISSDEAAMLMAPPLNSVPGFDIRTKPLLSLTDVTKKDSGKSIGAISERGSKIDGSSFTIDRNDVLKHIFVAGITGSGKTTTVKEILSVCEVPFLVLESAKREYRRLLANEQFKKLKVFTIGKAEVAPLRHNPFYILPGLPLNLHIDNLKSIFNASFSLYGPMPYILEKCLYRIYESKGWNVTTGRHSFYKIETFDDCHFNNFIYPTIVDLKNEVNNYVKYEMEYKGELSDNIRSAIVARLDSLAVGSKGFIFNTKSFINIEEFLNEQVIFELENLPDDDDKAFFVGLILSLISEYRQTLARKTGLDDNVGLKHILVIEEAHRLLENVQTERTSEMMGNPKGKAVNTFCNIISEMRSLGQGIIVAEQIPTKIAPDVIKNTNTKIIHRIVSHDEQIAIGASLGLDDDEARYLNQLTSGMAIAHKEGMAKPIEIKVNNNLLNVSIGDLKVARVAKSYYNGNLEEDLKLHESGLLWDDLTELTVQKLVVSFFLIEKEIQVFLPYLLKEIRSSSIKPLDDETVQLAAKHWFAEIILARSIGIANEGKSLQRVNDLVERLFAQKRDFGRAQFVSLMNKWANLNCEEKILAFVENSIILMEPSNPIEFQKCLESLLFERPPELVERIKTTLNNRLEAVS